MDETCKVTLGDRARFERIVADVDVVGVASEFDAFCSGSPTSSGFSTSSTCGQTPRIATARAGVVGGERRWPPLTRRSARTATMATMATTTRRWGWRRRLPTTRGRTIWCGRRRRPWAGCDDDDAAGGAMGAGSSTGREDGGYGCELRRRVNALRAASVEAKDGRTRVGGSPRAPCTCSRGQTLDGTRIRSAPSTARGRFYTSEPICKGFCTDLSALVRKDDARYECDRGCSFD